MYGRFVMVCTGVCRCVNGAVCTEVFRSVAVCAGVFGVVGGWDGDR